MAQVVLDSTNLAAVLADARGEDPAAVVVEGDAKQAKAPEPKAKAEAVEVVENDDAEGEDGLTAAERTELTAKMRRAVGRRVRERREAEEYAAAERAARIEAERQAREATAELERIRSATPVPAAEAKAKPQRQQFANEGEYIEAVTQFAVDEALAKRDREESQRLFEAERQSVIEAATKRMRAAAELVPDFLEVIEASDARISNEVRDYLEQSPLQAEVVYFLAQNPEVAQSLGKLKVNQALVEIGKLEAKLPPFAKAPAGEGKSQDGATPSTQGTTNGQQPPKAAPREATGETLSSARRAAPVIAPISANGSGSVGPDLTDVRGHIAEYSRKHGVNLSRRQRH